MAAGKPQQTELLFSGDVRAAKGAERPLDYRGSSGIPRRGPRRQTVEQEIRRARMRRGLRRQRGPCPFRRSNAPGKPAGELRCRKRIQIGRPSEVYVECLEPFGG